MIPRVSCVMLTARRRHLVATAIQCFLDQEYLNRELVVYDNGDSPILDLLPRDLTGPGRLIRYYSFHGQGRRTIGELRNTANDVTNGDLIVNWDDDDWSHPQRLSYQVAGLGDADVGGMHSCLFYDDQGDEPVLWKYEGGQGSPLGSSLICKRSFWRANPYLPLATGSDNFFWEDHHPVTVPGLLASGRCYLIARMHETNANREHHDLIRRVWTQDPERINLVWSQPDDPATLDRVKALLARSSNAIQFD